MSIASLAERVSGRRFTVWALLGLVLVPAVIAASFAWTQAEATEHLDRIEAAVVNLDEPVTVDGQYVPLGRVLVAKLTDPARENNLTWTNTDEETAADGLRTGRFVTVVTIPPSFSAAATSLAEQDPAAARHATLDLRTSPSAGVVDPTIGRAVAAAVTEALNTQLVETFVDRIFLGFHDLRDRLGEAADGAGRLADGAARLQGGLGEAGAGARELTAGLGELSSGSARLADGAQRLASGSDRLADGLSTMRDRTRDLPAQTRRLADGADRIRDGVNQADAELQRVLDLVAAADVDSARAAEQLASASVLLAQLSARLDEVAVACAAVPSPACDLVEPMRGMLAQQAATVQLLEQAAQLLDRAPQASAQLDRLVGGINRLADGTQQLAAGMPALASGIDRAATGARQVADGNARLAAGADGLASGAARAREGSAELGGGLSRLEDGAGRLADGAGRLEAGLREGVEQIPAYDAGERRSLAEVAAQPVRAGELRLPDPRLAAAYFTAVALGISALVLYTLLRAVPRRALTSSDGSLVLALRAWAPAVVIALLQAVAVALGMQLALDLSWPTLAGFAGVVLLAALSMAAVVQGLVALLGGTGRFVAVLALAVAAATAVISTTPPALRALVELTPVAPTIQALRDVVLGTGVGAEAAALVAWLVAGLVLTVVAIARQRTVSPARLRRLVASPVSRPSGAATGP